MGLKFYFSPYSTSNCTAAIFAELEDGQPEPLAERVEVSIKKGETHTPQYLAEVNPNGMVPAIVHDGVPIWESAAITIYLGEMFGVNRMVNGVEAALYPPPGPHRGEAIKWIVWSNIHIGTNSSLLYKAQSSGNKEVEKEAENTIAIKLGVLNGALEGKDYILGETYSLADTHLWTFVKFLSLLKVDLSSVANVKAWVERVGRRPQLEGH